MTYAIAGPSTDVNDTACAGECRAGGPAARAVCPAIR